MVMFDKNKKKKKKIDILKFLSNCMYVHFSKIILFIEATNFKSSNDSKQNMNILILSCICKD